MKIIARLWNAIPGRDQVKRLVIIFALILSGWLALRQKLVPATFGDAGHYRLTAIDEIEALPVSYLGQSICTECHDDINEHKSASYHRDLSCEICHGPGALHLEDPETHPLKAPKERSLCTVCHAYNPSRPTGFAQIDPMQHNPMEPCNNCHDPHDPTPPSTSEECGACHGEIARTKAISHHASLSCIHCHDTPDEHKSNPRVATPQKPADRQFCGSCHAESAESGKEILRVDLESHGGSNLCWECHYPHYPEAY